MDSTLPRDNAAPTAGGYLRVDVCPAPYDPTRAFVAWSLGAPPQDAVGIAAVNRAPRNEDGPGSWSERPWRSLEPVVGSLERDRESGCTYAALAWFTGDRQTKAKSAVVAKRTISADVDAKAMPGADEDERLAQSYRLAESVPGPRVVVQSGHGAQVHVLLPEGQRVEDHDDREDGIRHVEVLGRALRLYLEDRARVVVGAPVALDACHGAERVWRVPGGRNAKAGDANGRLLASGDLWREVRVRGDQDRVHALPAHDLAFLRPYLAAAEDEHDGRTAPAAPAEPRTRTTGRVPEGGRNNWAASRAGALRRIGLSPDAILGALRVENREKCVPPLADDELAAVARSIGAKPDGDTARALDLAKQYTEALQRDPAKAARILDVIVREMREVGADGDPLTALIASGAHLAPHTEGAAQPTVRYVLHPILVAGGLNFIHGGPKSSKSNLLLYCLIRALLGLDPIPGVIRCGDAPPTRVLVLSEMTHAQCLDFQRLYDPDLSLWKSGRIEYVSDQAKSLIRSPEDLGTVLGAMVTAGKFDVVVVDTFVAFATLAGGSLSESTDTARVTRALRSIPCTKAVVHHDRKAGSENGNLDHLAMLGAVEIRGSSDANFGLRIADPGTTLMEAALESRDARYMRYLAEMADYHAACRRGENRPEPEKPEVARRRWWLRLGLEDGRVVYVEAEPDIIPAEAQGATPKHERGDVVLAVNRALVELVRDAAEHGRPRVVPAEGIHVRVAHAWQGPGPAPGRRVVVSALDADPTVVRVAQGEYPGNGRAGGYGLKMYLPAPLGASHDPD